MGTGKNPQKLRICENKNGIGCSPDPLLPSPYKREKRPGNARLVATPVEGSAIAINADGEADGVVK